MRARGEHRNAEICRLLKAGDWKGMELMFRGYYKELVVWADTFLEDMALAEDVVQELFISLWEKRKHMEWQEFTLSSFLYVSVRNQCYHRLEKRDVLRHTADLQDVQKAFEEYNEKHDQILKNVLNELEQLPPRTRDIMTAVFVDGLKYREVAEKYGISVSTVKTLSGNAIRKLRERLGGDDYAIFLIFSRIKNNFSFH